MIKLNKLSRQLNFAHILHFNVAMIAIIVMNFVLLYKSINNYITNSLEYKTDVVEKLVSDKIIELEKSAVLVSNQIETTGTLQNQTVEAICFNPIIDTFFLVKSTYHESNSSWEHSFRSDSILISNYFFPHNADSQIQFVLKEDWIIEVIDQLVLPFPFNYLVISPQSDVVSSKSKYYYGKQIQTDIGLVHETYLATGIPVKIEFSDIKSKPSSKHYYLISVKFFNPLGLYVVVIHPRQYVFEYLGRYPAFITMILGFLLVLMTHIIIRSNQRLTRPYSEIVETLKSSKYVKIGNNKEIDDSMLIKRSIDMLHNQLNFYVKNLEKTSTAHLKIENDLKIAKRLQKNILPKDLQYNTKRDEFKIHAMSEAAYDIGGDLYDYFMLGKNHLLFAVADIAGKGIPAALFMIYTQTLLRSIAKSNMSVSEIVIKLNNKLAEDNISELFVTMLIGILDIRNGKLTYCNAAHNLPLIIKQKGSIEELNETHGIPLGIYANKVYAHSEITLSNSDQFMVYTDGVVDTKDENGMNYSVDVLKYNLMGSWFMTPSEVIDKVDKSVTAFRGNIAPIDDLTLLVIQYTHKGNIDKED